MWPCGELKGCSRAEIVVFIRLCRLGGCVESAQNQYI